MGESKIEAGLYRPPGRVVAGVLGDIQRHLRNTRFGVGGLTPQRNPKESSLDSSGTDERALALADRFSAIIETREELISLAHPFVHPSLGNVFASFKKGEYEYAVTYHKPYEHTRFIHIRRRKKLAQGQESDAAKFADGFEEKIAISSHSGPGARSKSYVRYFGPPSSEVEHGKVFHFSPGLIQSENSQFAQVKASGILEDLEKQNEILENVLIEGARKAT